MPDYMEKWGIGPGDVPAPDVGVGPTQSYSEPDFNAKWLGTSSSSQSQQSVPTTKKLNGFDSFVNSIPVLGPILENASLTGMAKSAGSALTLPGDVYQGKTAVDPTDPAFLGRVNTLGGIIGTGTIPSVSSAGKPLIDPATASLASLARDTYGIPVRGGQISESSGINYLDSVLKDKPFSGYAGNVADQHTAFNRAVANTIGEDADKITPEVMANAKTRLGQNYEDIAAQTTLKLDDKLGQDFTSIASDAQSVLAPNERGVIHSQIQNVLDKAQGAGEIDGKTFQALIKTGSPLDRATKSTDTNVKYYAGQVKQALVDAMGRSAPDDMQALLKQTNSQYKAMKTIEDLAEKSPTGDISPALLMGAVRKSYPNMAYGGGGDLADLARIGQRFLKEPPQSGTAPRLSALATLGLGGAGAAEATLAFHDPIMAAKIAALGGTAAIGKGIMNAGVGSALRSNWYANRLINSALPGPRNPGYVGNALEKLTNSDVPYLPPAAVMPQMQLPANYSPQNFL